MRAPHVLHRTRLSNDIGWKVTLHVKIKFGLIVFLSLSVCGGLHQKQPTFCVSILIWFILIYLSNHSGTDEAWEAVRPQGCSPLLVFVNSKSGDNQGVKFLRRFKQLLNPAQVFDLMNGGPGLGWEKISFSSSSLSPSCLFFLYFNSASLMFVCVCVTDRLRLFRHFDPFRILICSGDGSIGWVLSEIDKLHMDVSAVSLFFSSLLLVWWHQKVMTGQRTRNTHTLITTWILSFIVVQKQCQIGVLPLGTGNDLARVIGWGSVCDDDAHLPQLLERYEKASVKMLDRYNSFYTSTYSRSPMTFWNFLFLFVHPGGAFSRPNGGCLYLRPKSSCLTSPLPPSRTLSSVTWARSFNRTSTISSSHPPSEWRFHFIYKIGF